MMFHPKHVLSSLINELQKHRMVHQAIFFITGFNVIFMICNHVFSLKMFYEFTGAIQTNILLFFFCYYYPTVQITKHWCFVLTRGGGRSVLHQTCIESSPVLFQSVLVPVLPVKFGSVHRPGGECRIHTN